MTTSQPIRVLIVDDSAVVRGSFGRIIDAEPDMRVVTTAVNGKAAVDAIRQVAADVVLLDIEMPVMDGLTALPELLKARPSARVVMTSTLTQEGAAVTMRALALGASDFIHKPQAKEGVQGLAHVSRLLVEKVRALGQSGSAQSRHPAAHPVISDPPDLRTPKNRPPSAEPRILAIAASTGGPNALAEVIKAVPEDFSLPIVITQHMPPIFTAMLAQRLAREGSLPCDEARDGDVVVGGRVYIAPGDHHMLVTRSGTSSVIRLNQGEPENYCRPAADPMFRSVAQAYGASAIAVVLTGMGEDGRRGCEALSDTGARIIAQDQATSVVWGMPGSVVDSGVPCTVLPLTDIVPHVLRTCQRAASRAAAGGIH